MSREKQVIISSVILHPASHFTVNLNVFIYSPMKKISHTLYNKFKYIYSRTTNHKINFPQTKNNPPLCHV